MRRIPAQIRRIRAGKPSRGVTTPVSLVYLPVSLTGPGPSGSAEPARLCRGCSRPSRRPPGRAASSFIPPLRRRHNGRSFTSIRNTRASWRSYDRPTAPRSAARTPTGFPCSAHVRHSWDRAPSIPRGRRCSCDRREARGRRLPLHNGQPLSPRYHHPPRGARITRRHQGFTGIRPSSLPLACGPSAEPGPLGIP